MKQGKFTMRLKPYAGTQEIVEREVEGLIFSVIGFPGYKFAVHKRPVDIENEPDLGYYDVSEVSTGALVYESSATKPLIARKLAVSKLHLIGFVKFKQACDAKHEFFREERKARFSDPVRMAVNTAMLTLTETEISDLKRAFEVNDFKIIYNGDERKIRKKNSTKNDQ